MNTITAETFQRQMERLLQGHFLLPSERQAIQSAIETLKTIPKDKP